jgi:multidrug resistance efflux pump
LNMLQVLKYPLRILAVAIAVLAILGLIHIDQVAKGQGKLVPGEEIWVSSLVNARVKNICVREGQAVVLGDTLIELENDLAKSRLSEAKYAHHKAVAEREAAQAALEALGAPPLKQELTTLQSELDALEEKARLTSRQLFRTQQLMSRGGFVSSKDLEEARAESVLVASQVAKLKASLEMLELGPIGPLRRKALFELKAREAEVARAKEGISLADQVLANHTILAPVDGHILMILCKRGTVPAVGDTLMLLGTKGEMLVECRIPSEFGPWLRPGQEATLWPEWEKWYEFTGTVKEVRKYVEQRSASSILVRVALNSQPPLIYGNEIKVEIKLRRASILRLLFSPFDWASARSN